MNASSLLSNTHFYPNVHGTNDSIVVTIKIIMIPNIPSNPTICIGLIECFLSKNC